MIERGHLVDGTLNVGFVGEVAFLSGSHEADAKGFGKEEFTARQGRVVAFEIFDGDLAGDSEAKDGFGGIDAVAASKRKAELLRSACC